MESIQGGGHGASGISRMQQTPIQNEQDTDTHKVEQMQHMLKKMSKMMEGLK